MSLKRKTGDFFGYVVFAQENERIKVNSLVLIGFYQIPCNINNQETIGFNLPFSAKSA
jgi:hypothetical protein